ncbi:hypothetical protein AK812_SmicGene25716 [Symbiodinium microadriaticum]|uniref:Uncharacterized protein n=1 Tax=Symbiodinium microadriaticum TaxID=2951 RepID=A0A1Q9DBD6_SYMMI|nr:hypothetical protein AK812_SmicGene25716 [Symbiodinium microadriaticum]
MRLASGRATEIHAILSDPCPVADALGIGSGGAAFESQPLTATAALRHAVEHAANEVARVRSCHTTWKASTEARIYRLENAKEEAEKATQDYLVVEAKLGSFRHVGPRSIDWPTM